MFLTIKLTTGILENKTKPLVSSRDTLHELLFGVYLLLSSVNLLTAQTWLA